jgi:hypothetical protein
MYNSRPACAASLLKKFKRKNSQIGKMLCLTGWIYRFRVKRLAVKGIRTNSNKRLSQIII